MIVNNFFFIHGKMFAEEFMAIVASLLFENYLKIKSFA
jgi:hypothetical protein